MLRRAQNCFGPDTVLVTSVLRPDREPDTIEMLAVDDEGVPAALALEAWDVAFGSFAAGADGVRRTGRVDSGIGTGPATGECKQAGQREHPQRSTPAGAVAQDGRRARAWRAIHAHQSSLRNGEAGSPLAPTRFASTGASPQA